MFGWLKKKQDAQRNEAVVSESIHAPATSIAKLTREDAQMLFEASFKGNAHASVFYAQCAGMKNGILSDNNIPQFFDKVLRVEPSSFVREDISRAVDYRLSECFDGLLSDIWELSVGVISTDEYSQRTFRESGMPQKLLKDPEHIEVGKNSILRNSLQKLRDKIIRIEARQPYRSYFEAFDVEQVMLDVCLKRRSDDYEKLKNAIDDKVEVLRPIFSRLRNSSKNKYGDYDPGPEIDELDEFLNYTFEEDDFDFYFTIRPHAQLLDYISHRLEQGGALNTSDIPEGGIDFEHWCADHIGTQGWEVSVSQASGDQGVDVVAIRDQTKVAIQCKRYSQPVGNKAVQEAYSGCRYAGAQFACVISTGGYTRSAKELASSTDVMLLDAFEISKFSELFGFEPLSLEGVDGDLDEVDDGEDVKVFIAITGRGGGYIGTLLRSLIKSAGPEQYGIKPEVGTAILDSLDKETGYGAFAVDRASAGTLLILAARGLKTIVHLDEGNVENMRGSLYYDPQLVETYAGGSVALEIILKEDVASDAYEFLFETSGDLGGLMQNYANEKLTEILIKSE
jgi:hypothetical protein